MRYLTVAVLFFGLSGCITPDQCRGYANAARDLGEAEGLNNAVKQSSETKYELTECKWKLIDCQEMKKSCQDTSDYRAGIGTVP